MSSMYGSRTEIKMKAYFTLVTSFTLRRQWQQLEERFFDTNVTVWENPAYSKFYDFLVSYIFDSSTIGLTRVQVSERLCASLWRYSALFTIAPHPQ